MILNQQQRRKFAWHRRTWVIAALSIWIGAVAARPARAQKPRPPTDNNYINSLELADRADWQKPDEVITRLAIKPGQAVADLGAGSGYFTLLFAKAVGPQGKVYAIDILPEMLDYIRQRAKNDSIKNIQLVQASAHDPKLAPASVDLIFICDTLHHISDRPNYYPLLIRALRPHGRLVNIDFYKKPLPVGPAPASKIDKQAMIDEAKAAGFHVVQDYDFLTYQYFLVFEH